MGSTKVLIRGSMSFGLSRNIDRSSYPFCIPRRSCPLSSLEAALLQVVRRNAVGRPEIAVSENQETKKHKHGHPKIVSLDSHGCCFDIHACMHACMHACIHTYIHTYIHSSEERFFWVLALASSPAVGAKTHSWSTGQGVSSLVS